MLILDEKGKPVAKPDLEKGRIEERDRIVIHTYVVDVEEVSHTEVVREYPETGGKDLATVVDVPEEGHWETRLENGDKIEFDGEIPEDAPHELPVPDVQVYAVYRKYTKEELAEIARKREEREQAEAKRAETEKYLDEAPERTTALEAEQAETDDAICKLYENSLKMQAEFDDAVCTIYENQEGAK